MDQTGIEQAARLAHISDVQLAGELIHLYDAAQSYSIASDALCEAIYRLAFDKRLSHPSRP